MMVPPYVREPMFSRPLDFETVLSCIKVPGLVIHGSDDDIIKPAMSELTLSWVPDAKSSVYDKVGHTPFREDPDRFNSELAAFVHSC